jgi:hypothetical protein
MVAFAIGFANKNTIAARYVTVGAVAGAYPLSALILITIKV